MKLLSTRCSTSLMRIGDPVIVYFIARAVMSQRKYVSWVIGAIFAVGVYSVPMGLYDHFTGRMSLAAISGISASLLYNDVGGRAAGPFLSPMHLGMMMGIAIALAVNYAQWTRKVAAKAFYYLCIPFMAVCCFIRILAAPISR